MRFTALKPASSTGRNYGMSSVTIEMCWHPDGISRTRDGACSTWFWFSLRMNKTAGHVDACEGPWRG